MRNITVVIALTLFVVAIAVAADAAEKAVVWPASDIKWVDNPAIKGAKTAVLWGDPKTGAYGALKSLPSGFTLALHTHTNDERVIPLSGTISLSVDGGPARDLPAGSYVFLPAGVQHGAVCKTGSDCVYFSEQPGASDIKFVN